MYPPDLTWIELREYVERARGPLILPVGSVESHGAHLPINTDTLIATAIADTLAERNRWISLPPITYTIAVPARPGNVYIPIDTFRSYIKAIIEHFVLFGQRFFIVILGHGGPDMKTTVVEACSDLCRAYSVSIAAFHVSHVLSKLHLVDTSIDRHAGAWETSMVMAIDSSLVKNMDLYRDLEKPEEFRRYGVAGNPLKADAKWGQELINAVVGYIERHVTKQIPYTCYFDWLQ